MKLKTCADLRSVLSPFIDVPRWARLDPATFHFIDGMPHIGFVCSESVLVPADITTWIPGRSGEQTYKVALVKRHVFFRPGRVISDDGSAHADFGTFDYSIHDGLNHLLNVVNGLIEEDNVPDDPDAYFHGGDISWYLRRALS